MVKTLSREVRSGSMHSDSSCVWLLLLLLLLLLLQGASLAGACLLLALPSWML